MSGPWGLPGRTGRPCPAGGRRQEELAREPVWQQLQGETFLFRNVLFLPAAIQSVRQPRAGPRGAGALGPRGGGRSAGGCGARSSQDGPQGLDKEPADSFLSEDTLLRLDDMTSSGDVQHLLRKPQLPPALPQEVRGFGSSLGASSTCLLP